MSRVHIIRKPQPEVVIQEEKVEEIRVKKPRVLKNIELIPGDHYVIGEPEPSEDEKLANELAKFQAWLDEGRPSHLFNKYKERVGNFGRFKVVKKSVSDFDGAEIIVCVSSHKSKPKAIDAANTLNKSHV